MGQADESSREEYQKKEKKEDEKAQKKQKKINKYVLEKDGIKYWKFENGTMKISPDEANRKKIVIDKHEE